MVFLQPRSGLVGCSEGLYLEERQNAKGMFRPEHCVWFSVLVRNINGQEKGQRNAYLWGEHYVWSREGSNCSFC